MARLRKPDAETIIAAVDSPELVPVLTQALRRVLEIEGDWEKLVARAGSVAGWSVTRVEELTAHYPDWLFALACELNEMRTIIPTPVPKVAPATQSSIT